MNIAIILMAGKGERAETTIPKQYIIIDGKSNMIIKSEKIES